MCKRQGEDPGLGASDGEPGRSVDVCWGIWGVFVEASAEEVREHRLVDERDWRERRGVDLHGGDAGQERCWWEPQLDGIYTTDGFWKSAAPQ